MSSTTAKGAWAYRALWSMPNHRGTVRDMIKLGAVPRDNARSAAQALARLPKGWVENEPSGQFSRYGENLNELKLWKCVGPTPEEAETVRERPVVWVAVFDIEPGMRAPLRDDDGVLIDPCQWELEYWKGMHSLDGIFGPGYDQTHVQIGVGDVWVGVGSPNGPETACYRCVLREQLLPVYADSIPSHLKHVGKKSQ